MRNRSTATARPLARILLLAVALPLGTGAADFQETGDAIAQRVYDRNTGNDSHATAEMRLFEGGREQRRRDLILATKKQQGLQRLYLRFTAPPFLENTALLSLETASGRSDQFLYLPELRRARRVDMGQRGGRFVGTDFTFEDLEVKKVSQYEHRLVGNAACGPGDSRQCWIIDSTPRAGTGSQYARLRRWIARDLAMDLRIDFYGRDGQLLRRSTVEEVTRVDGIWTAMRSTMRDLRQDRRTELSIRQIRYNQGLPDRMFTTGYLQQAN